METLTKEKIIAAFGKETGCLAPDRRSETDAGCPLRDILDRIGGKWSVLVVILLKDDRRRFSDLRRMIDGISQRMLTQTLRHLERDGLVDRTVYPSVPMRVEYELTPLGRTLTEPLAALAAWAEGNRSAILSARAAYDRRDDTQRPQPTLTP